MGVYAKWNGTEGARLLREMRVYVRPHRLKAEEAHGPPAESERLQCNETAIVQILQHCEQSVSLLHSHAQWKENGRCETLA